MYTYTYECAYLLDCGDVKEEQDDWEGTYNHI